MIEVNNIPPLPSLPLSLLPSSPSLPPSIPPFGVPIVTTQCMLTVFFLTLSVQAETASIIKYIYKEHYHFCFFRYWTFVFH